MLGVIGGIYCIEERQEKILTSIQAVDPLCLQAPSQCRPMNRPAACFCENYKDIYPW